MFDMSTFVEKCRAALSDAKPAQVIEGLIGEAIRDPEALRKAFQDAAGTDATGPITFAFRDETLTVADVTAAPGLRSPVHNHNMWAVIGVYEGEEQNTFFRHQEGELKEMGQRLLRKGDIAVLGPEAIHAIANPLPTASSAIHVYGGDLVARAGRSMWNPNTMAREDYDIEQLSKYTRELSGVA